MKTQLQIYNSYTGEKTAFVPINPPHIGMYVCGPTVYSDAHLGNCRTFVSFDIVYRYLTHLGYKVRYVRNITDVGHLEGDADTDAEDKISKKARLEQLEPMEIVQHYTNGFHAIMHELNTLPPSIEPRATGHILEQIEMVQIIIANGYGYLANGSVYFDTAKFIQDNEIYGRLSGKVVEDLLAETRDNLKNQSEKRHPSDFAIWIKADPRHLMRWNSPWSVGFPGWHLECSAMSTKYLGNTFDIHGGGNDLKFPHHENEIAQNFGACGCLPANVWMHGNMLLLNGRKMSKSPDPVTGKSNSISPRELFTGENQLFEKAFTPMVVRFFMLQAHYRSTLDLTNDALMAAEKGYRRLMEANATLQTLDMTAFGKKVGELDTELQHLMDAAFEVMSDDFNTPQTLAKLFEIVPKINGLKGGQLAASEVLPATIARLRQVFNTFLFDIFGLKDETKTSSTDGNADTLDKLMDLVLALRQNARQNKDWTTADKIRDGLKTARILLKDSKEGTSWSKE